MSSGENASNTGWEMPMEERIEKLLTAGWCFPHNCLGGQCGGPHNYKGAETADPG